jgi:CubicO group peptidase (beta-lactamase class C family)
MNIVKGKNQIPQGKEDALERMFIMIMKKTFRLAIFVMLVVFCFAQSCIAQASTVTMPSFQQIRSEVVPIIEEEMERTGTVGLSVAVIDGNRIVWSEGFGWADKAKHIPATPETVYQLASISKVFTVLAAMKLAEQEQMDIDKPIQSYLPSFSMNTRFPNAEPITARNIMTHHSGIPSDYFKIDLTKPASQVTAALKGEYVCFPPNYVFSYSNPGIIVLGDTIAAITGKPYHQYVRETLLDPLGMRHSFFETEPERLETFAKSYEKGKEKSILPTIGILPAAGLYSNTLDLAKFVKMLFADGNSVEQQVFRKEILQETWRAQNEQIPLDGTLRVGLGWMLGDSSIRYAGTIAGHEGHFNGYATNIAILPDHKLGVIILSNSSEAARLVSTIADDILQRTLAVKKSIYPPVETAILTSKIPASKPSSADLAGYYGTHLGVIQVTNNKKELLARSPDLKVSLIPRGNNYYSMQYSWMGFIPIQLNKGTYFSFETLQGRQIIEITNNRGMFVIGEKAPQPYLTDAWREMAGSYELTSAATDFSLIPRKITCKIENEQVIIEMRNPLKEYPEIKTWGFIIHPLTAEEGTVIGLGRWKGDTVRREVKNSIPHIFFAGLEFRKVDGVK